MEPINEFFKELKSRVSNPLISSFIIAWLFFNWPIVIGILLYKNLDLKIDGYRSYFALIDAHINTWDNFIKPFLSAIIYTFGFPAIRNLVYAAQSWYRRWGKNWIFKISKNEPITISHYQQLQKKYVESEKELVGLIKHEAVYRQELDTLKSATNEEIRLLSLKLSERETTINNQFQKLSYPNGILDGIWNIMPYASHFNSYDTVVIKNMSYKTYNNRIIENTYEIDTIIGNKEKNMVMLVLKDYTAVNRPNLFARMEFVYEQGMGNVIKVDISNGDFYYLGKSDEPFPNVYN